MATIRWCPIFPKWDSYQPLHLDGVKPRTLMRFTAWSTLPTGVSQQVLMTDSIELFHHQLIDFTRQETQLLIASHTHKMWLMYLHLVGKTPSILMLIHWSILCEIFKHPMEVFNPLTFFWHWLVPSLIWPKKKSNKQLALLSQLSQWIPQQLLPNKN